MPLAQVLLVRLLSLLPLCLLVFLLVHFSMAVEEEEAQPVLVRLVRLLLVHHVF